MSLTSAFETYATANPGKTAIAFGRDAWTFSEFHRLSRNVGQNLIEAGAEPGDRVALHLLNGPEFALAAAGCLKAGLIGVPINTRLKGREIDYILRHSGSAFYIGEAQSYDSIIDLCPALHELGQPYIHGAGNQNTQEFDALLRTPARDRSFPAVPEDETAVIMYTSGTTAHPKGVVQTHGTLFQTAQAELKMQLNEDQVVVVMSSMAHLVGFGMCFTAALANGATTVITRPFECESALDAFERWRGTCTVTLPVLLQSLLKAQLQKARDLSSARLFFCGGDSVTPALQESFAGAIAPICEVYGSTEITPSCWNRPGEIRVGSIGKPNCGVQFRLLDSQGAEVPDGSVGEIYIRGPHLTTGYWRDPDATSAAFQNGWYRSGDLGFRDADGFYWFAGRRKEIIVRGGSNISPQEVEAALYDHPAVAEAGVVGRRDSFWGEVVIAHVALRAGYQLDERELIAFTSERLADYKLPAAVVFHPDLPKGITGKIQRRALRDEQIVAAAS
jgi:long-chain acyl-CoA synthetase